MKILISAAKTGGHIFPAIAVGNELKHNGHDIVLLVQALQLRPMH
jgi:UDP-N-acetylglucosamine:LPS N-acetylglucosamine transferase